MQKAKFVITQHSFNLYTRAKVTNCTVKRLKPNRVGIIVHYEKFKYMYVSGIIQAHHNVRPRDATMMKYRQIARFRWLSWTSAWSSTTFAFFTRRSVHESNQNENHKSHDGRKAKRLARARYTGMQVQFQPKWQLAI